MDMVQKFFGNVSNDIWLLLDKYDSKRHKTKAFRKIAANATIYCEGAIGSTEYDDVYYIISY